MRDKTDLRPGQQAIATHVYEHDEGIIVLEPGGGKTAAILTAIRELIDDGEVDRVVVLAPPKVSAGVWPREPGKWRHLDGMPVFDATGSPAARKKAYAAWSATPGGILTASLQNAKAIAQELSTVDLGRALLVIDEISMLKAPTGVLAKAAEAFAARFAMVWGLTGTPRPNGWEDLFRPVRIVSRGRVWGAKNFTEWRRDHFRPMDLKGYRWEVHSFAEKQLEADARKVLFTAPPEHIEGMPPLRAGPDFDVWVDLPPKARAAYDKMEKEYVTRVIRELRGEDEESLIVALTAGVASAKLTQLAQGYIYDEGEAVSVAHAEKTDALAELLDTYGDEPTVICYGYKQDLEAIRKLCGPRVPVLGDGTSTARARQYIEAFEKGETRRLAMHPASAGHGVDGLQHGGRRMVWLCPTWSQEQYQQTLRRLHRPGQTLPVYSQRVLARGTVDELKVGRVEGKAAQEAAFKAMLKRVGEA